MGSSMIGTCEESRYIPFRCGGGGHPDPEIREGGADLKKNFFRPFRAQFGLKIEGAPLLDPPL